MIIELIIMLTGTATFYSPGVMEEVYVNRLAWGQVQPCLECVGMVALNDSAHLGTLVWLDWPGSGITGPYLVVDCAARQHRQLREQQGRVVEVDWSTAQRFKMHAPVAGVRILQGEICKRSIHPSALTRRAGWLMRLSWQHRRGDERFSPTVPIMRRSALPACQ